MNTSISAASDGSGTAEQLRSRRREAFAYANRTNAIEALPPPSELGLQVQEATIEGRLTFDEGIGVLVKHNMATGSFQESAPMSPEGQELPFGIKNSAAQTRQVAPICE